ncbi:MAG: GNAT family acetyltransferase [Pseudomonadales bacterium]
MIEIRTYHTNDERDVVELWQLAFPDEPAWNESKALISRKLTVQPELFFVAEHAGKVVGTTIAGFDGVRGWVHKVATHPDYLRRGIATSLMQAAEQGLKRLGCTKLNLQVRAGNDSAQAAYEAMGYQVETRVSLGKHL